MYDSNQTFGQGMGPNAYPRPYINPAQQTSYPYPLPGQQQSFPGQAQVQQQCYPGQIQQNQPYLIPQEQQNQYNYNIPTQDYQSHVAKTEESFVENLLRLNRGRQCTIFCTYPNSQEWRDRTYKGVIENAGHDHVIISDPNTGARYCILGIYIDWIEFYDEIIFDYPIR